ncbi:MAG: ketopantoate reductase family protein [Candidatus Thorarchaeota archaeon]
MRVLFYGAGVIGSFYAAQLFSAGYDVTILARGKRLEDIKKHGIVIDHFLQKQQTITKVPVIDKLEENDVYDFIFVIMQKNQTYSILPYLKKNRFCYNIVFLGNNGTGGEEYIESVGKERILLGFPSIGGKREGHKIIVAYQENSSLTIGELNGLVSRRVVDIATMFNKADILVKTSDDIDSWLKYHIALVSPLANGVHLAEKKGFELRDNEEAMLLMIKAIKEGFKVLKKLKYPIRPKRMRTLYYYPNFMIIRILKKTIGTEVGRLVLREHAITAKEEMKKIADEFQQLVKESGIITPSINELYEYIK